MSKKLTIFTIIILITLMQGCSSDNNISETEKGGSVNEEWGRYNLSNYPANKKVIDKTTAETIKNVEPVASNTQSGIKTMYIDNMFINTSMQFLAVDKDGGLWISIYKDLYYSLDNGETKTLIHKFDYGIQSLHVLKSGTILVRLNVNETSKLYRSTDNGLSWSADPVLDPCPGYLAKGFLESLDGTLFFVSYSKDGKIYRSDNDGISFYIVNTIRDILHFHQIQEDPYNPGTLYITTGDSDIESRVYKSTDKCENMTVFGQGAQMWRAVSLLFTKDYLYWGMDSTDSTQPAYIIRCARDNPVPELLKKVNAPIYYAWKTARGELLFATNPESNGSQYPAVNIYYSRDGIEFNVIFSWQTTIRDWYTLYFIGEHEDQIYLYLVSQTIGLDGKVDIIAKITDAIATCTVIQDNWISGSTGIARLGSANNQQAVILSNRKTDIARVTKDGFEILGGDNGIIIQSQNGTKYKLSVTDTGEIKTEKFSE